MSAAEMPDEPPSTLHAIRALREALRLVAAGYQLTPVTITRGSDGKKRALFHENWRRDSAWSKDPDKVRDWSAQHACSFAIRTGPAGGCDVVDLDGDEGILWWSERGHPLGLMVVDTISGGLHSFSKACGLPTAAKRLAPHVDTRGEGGLVFAPGSFIIGEEGTYSVRGPLVPVAELTPLPAELVAEIQAAKPESADHPDDGRVTVHDREWMIDRTKAAVDKVGGMPPYTDGDEFRNAQMGASMMLGRLVDIGLCDPQTAWEIMEEATLKVWPDGLSDDDRSNIRKGLADGPRKERWEIRDPLSATSGSDASEVADSAESFELEVARKVREIKIADEARRRIADERNARRPRIADELIDDLDDVEPPQMLLGGLIPEDGVGFIGGKSGAYKSFLATSWGCCIATGRPWLDRPEFFVRRKLKTLYVAAEGAGGAAARIRAWETANGADRKGLLTLYKKPINLADPSRVEELMQVIRDRDFGFVVLDTYHRAAQGVNENASDEFGVVFEAAAQIRDELGCGVLFVDHTGHAGERLRGTSSKGDNADYVLISTYDGTNRDAGVQRTLKVFKLKDEDSSASWAIKLRPVDGAAMPVVDIGSVGNVGPFGLNDDLTDWWRVDQCPEMPGSVADAIQREAAKDRNRGADAARWVWRYLALVDDELGVTRGQIQRALEAIPRDRPFGPTAVEKAVPLLDRAGVIGRDRTRVWLLP
jgi:hypothetical protein